MNTNILLASFAGGMIGGFAGAYIATRNYNKQIEKEFVDDVDEESTSSEESNSEAENESAEKDNKFSKEPESEEKEKEASPEDNKEPSVDAKPEAENESAEKLEHVDGETVGVDSTATINDTEPKSVSFTIVNDNDDKVTK